MKSEVTVPISRSLGLGGRALILSFYPCLNTVNQLRIFRYFMFLLQASDVSIVDRWQESMMRNLYGIVDNVNGPLYSLLPDSQVIIREISFNL